MQAADVMHAGPNAARLGQPLGGEAEPVKGVTGA